MGEERVAGWRLAAIMAADPPVHRPLTRADEDGAVTGLRTQRRELNAAAIPSRTGRIIKAARALEVIE